MFSKWSCAGFCAFEAARSLPRMVIFWFLPIDIGKEEWEGQKVAEKEIRYVLCRAEGSILFVDAPNLMFEKKIDENFDLKVVEYHVNVLNISN